MEDTPPELVQPDAMTVALMAPPDSEIAVAVRGQLAGSDVAVRAHPRAALDAASPLDAARTLARSAEARAVVWFQRDGDRVTLYLFDARAATTYAREFAWAGTEATTAEVLAVAARRALRSLPAGYPAGMSPFDLPPPKSEHVESTPTATEPPRAPQRHRARFVAAYVGTRYAAEHRWVSGVGAWASWLAPAGVYAAVGYHLLAATRAHNDDAALKIRRHPIDVLVGYRWVPRHVGFQVELAGLVDIVTTSTEALGTAVAPRDATHTDLGVGTRARLDYAPLSWLSILVGGGVDVYPGAAPFVVRTTSRSTLVAPFVARPRMSAGLSARF